MTEQFSEERLSGLSSASPNCHTIPHIRAAQITISRHHSRLPIPLSHNLILNPATDEAMSLRRGAGQRAAGGTRGLDEKERLGPSRFGAAGDPQNKRGPPRLGGGRAPRGAGRSRRRQRTQRQLKSPSPLSFPRASSLKIEGNLRAKGDGLPLLLLQTVGREVLSPGHSRPLL